LWLNNHNLIRILENNNSLVAKLNVRDGRRRIGHVGWEPALEPVNILIAVTLNKRPLNL
jgi:hypothetical protein